MKDIKNIAVVIQARLGSQRVPQKMIKPFAGTTLTDIAIKKIKKSKVIDKTQFYMSVYESELLDISAKHDTNVYLRSEASANSEGTPMTEMYEWWNKLPHEYCVLINPCVPFLKIETIDNFIQAYADSDSDGMFGVMKKKNYFWRQDGSIVTPLTEDVMNTKTVPFTYEAAHCLYAGRMDKISEGIWMGDFNKPGDIELFPMEEEECLDIDYLWQFEMCEKLYEARNEK
jgi:CMP-N-acetylneuraminic acid synthetase